jgi:hypothetical protein
MGECYVTTTIKSPTPIAFEIGDYLEYRNERFEINYDPTVIKAVSGISRGEEFKYSDVKFNSLSDELTRCDFLDYVSEDNQIHFTSLPNFSFYASSIADLAERIQVNLDRIYTDDKKWTVEVNEGYVDKTNISISVSNIKVWGALELVNTKFKANFIIRGRTITIGTAGVPINTVLRQGKGKGLYQIKREADSNQEIITRLRAYGSTTNMPSRYYNKLSTGIPNNMAVTNLMLPSFPDETLDPYIDSPNIETLGIREATVFFDGSDDDLDEIFPHLESEVVDAEQATDDGTWDELEEGDEIPSFKIYIKNIGFDINDYLSTESATISFKSGMCAGREFEITGCAYNKETDQYELTCNRVEDTDIDLYFPNQYYNIKSGDTYTLLNIEMPDVYIKEASQELLAAAQAYLAKNDYTKYIYTPEIDEIQLRRQHDEAIASDGVVDSIYLTIKEGDLMLFEDDDIKVTGSITIDTLKITEEDGKLPTIKVTLTDEKTVGTIEKIQNQIDSIISGVGAGGIGGYSAVQIRQLVQAFGREMFLSKTSADTAKGLIQFIQGLTVGSGAYGMTADGKAKTSGMTAGDYVAGYQGAAIDSAGNAEFESIFARSYLKVFELIYNRLNALEGNTSFADVGTIETIEDNEDGSQTAVMRKRWDADFTAFQKGDVVYGYVNNLTSDSEVKEYYKAWAQVKDVDRDLNTLTLVPYPDEEVPAKVNHPMTAEMIITRWGNNIEANATTASNPDYVSFIVADGTETVSGVTQTKYRNTRQQSFYISCDDGNIVELMGVRKPTLEEGNYGAVFGQIPAGLLDDDTMAKLNTGQPYLYARGVIYQDLIQVNYKGLIRRTANYRGMWSYDTATSDNPYESTTSSYDTVTYNGVLWQCLINETTEEPSTTASGWGQMTASPEEVKVWTINPSANIVSIRRNEIRPETLSCTVTLATNSKTISIDDSATLLKKGAILQYSIDDVAWAEFLMGNEEPIELEDGSGYIETESGTEYITIGGDNVSTDLIGDRIIFRLIDKTSGDELARTHVPVVKDGARGAFTSTVFVRCSEQPAPPSGGTYENPIPDWFQINKEWFQWSDGIPEGDAILWASSRVFSDSEETLWSMPSQMTDTSYYDVEFSDVDEEPGNPTDNPANWYDPTDDAGKVDFTKMLWRAEKVCRNGKWGDWTIVRIKGEKGTSGQWTSYAFATIQSDGNPPARPTDSEHTIPNDGNMWYDAPLGADTWFMTKATIDGATAKPIADADGNYWSEPVQCTAEDGVNGSYVDFKYRAYAETDTVELTEAQQSQRNPEGWKDTPPTLSVGQVLYMIQATIQDDKLKGTWSTPVRISGERGDDGTDGASYTVNLLDGTNCGTDNWNIYIGNTNGWYAPQDDGTYLNAASGESIKPYRSEMVATEGKGVGLTIIQSDGTPTIATDSLGIAFRYPIASEKLIKGRTYTLSFRTGFGGTRPQKVLCDIKPINGDDYLAPQASAVINSIYDKLSVKFTLTENGTDISGDIYVNIRFVSMTWASSGSQGVVVGDIKLEEGDNDKPLWTKSEADKVGADGKDGKDAQSQFVSTVFLRQDDTPDTPQGGSFAQPLPDGEQWSDGIPSGTAKLWYSHRRFTSDGASPQEDTWTTPAVLADSADFDVEYCTKAKYDSAPQGHPNTNTEWSNDATEDAVWMATCSKSANGDWSEWVVAKIKGENGADAENYWLVVNPTSVNVDNYGDSSVINITARIMHQTGNGAVEEIDSEYTQEEAYCYYIEVIYSLNGKKTALILDGDSDKPVTVSATKAWEYVTFNLMKGYDGRYAATLQTVTVPFVANGITADWVSYVFKAADADGIPTQPTDSDKTIPDGWSDAPTAEGVWYMSKATIDGTTSLPKKDSNGDYWSAPVQCTAEDGENGEYTDFKYQAAKAGDLVAYNATSDNPGSGWRDTPYYLDYDSSIQQYIWMITAVKVNGKLKDGTTWSTPVRINGEDGKDGKDGEKGDKGDKGEDGIGSTTYQLVVSPQTVRVTASGEVYAISKTVTAYVVQTYGSKTDKLDTRTLLRDANLKLYVKGISQSDSDAIEITNGTSKDNLEVSIVYSNNEKAYWTSGGSITVDTKTQFDFILKKADTTTETEIARETVTLVADGAKGDKGEQGKQGEAGAAGERGQIGNMLYPAGVYNSATEYTSTGTLSPFVLYLNSYYYLLPNKTYCGEAAANGDPASDYANSSNPSWAKFQQFNAVFTELLMANFAKLASAVFSGDYMFSQKGTRRVMKNMWMSKAEGTKVGSTAVKNYSYTDIQLINGTYNGDTVEARFLITKDEDDTPSVELNGTTPVGWSVIPQERSSNDDVLWLITRTNSGSWSTPQKIVFDTSSTEGNTISLYAFQIRDIQAAKPIAESTTGGWLSAWSKYPSPVVYEDDGSYAEFDGSMELFEPNFSVDLMTGNVRANKGVFKGIVTNDTTVITPDNYLDYMTKSYFSAVNRTYYKLNLSKCANRIIFKDTTTKFNSDTMIFYTIQMPVFENDASYTDEYLEQVRSYIGTTLTIYNYSVATITIDCASAVGATSHSSTYLRQNQCISLRCVLNVNGIDECVVWETYGTANAIIASK